MILAIETSTKNCSVALVQKGVCIALKEAHSDQYIHSEKLHLFIEDLMREASVSFNDLEAVAVGMGPGSYTGLRIGVSAAKGLCYALQIPLISIDGLSILAAGFLQEQNIEDEVAIISMIDARRMEVYCSIFNAKGNIEQPIEAKVIDESSFADVPYKTIHCIGDGALKTREILTDSRFVFHNFSFPSAATLGIKAYEKFQEKAFEDVAYFEPFYLKDFIAGKPKKML